MSLRRILNVLLAIAAFAVVSSAIRAALPWPAGYGLRAKVEYFRRNMERYDTVFLGSSYTFRAVEPQVFDGALRKGGVEASTFNFGVPGITAFELHHLLEELVAMQPTHLKRVFVEHMQWRTKTLDRAREIDDRSIYWHTWSTTSELWRSLWLQQAAVRQSGVDDGLAAERLGLAWLHLKLMARRYSNYAEAPRLLERVLRDDPTYAYLTRAELEEQHGFQDPDTLLAEEGPAARDPDAPLRRRMFAADQAGYRAALDQTVEMHKRRRHRQQSGQLSQALAEYNVAGVEEQVAALQGLGAELVYQVPPVLGEFDEAYALEEAGVYPAFLGLCDPIAWADLFRPEHRFDRGHLNRRGAHAFSVALAEEYLRRSQRARH